MQLHLTAQLGLTAQTAASVSMCSLLAMYLVRSRLASEIADVMRVCLVCTCLARRVAAFRGCLHFDNATLMLVWCSFGACIGVTSSLPASIRQLLRHAEPELKRTRSMPRIACSCNSSEVQGARSNSLVAVQAEICGVEVSLSTSSHKAWGSQPSDLRTRCRTEQEGGPNECKRWGAQ